MPSSSSTTVITLLCTSMSKNDEMFGMIELSRLTLISDVEIILIISLADSTPDIALPARVSVTRAPLCRASEWFTRKVFLAACNSSSETVKLLSVAKTSEVTCKKIQKFEQSN